MFPSGLGSSVGSRTIILRAPAPIAIRIARLFPCLKVLAFDDDWSAIDRARAAADALGLSARVLIHLTSPAPPGLLHPPHPARAA
jgi:precorrin-6B methylase 2